MDSIDVNRATGADVTDFQHVIQSIGDIFSTPVGSRVLARPYGSAVPALIDKPMTQQWIMRVIIAASIAIARWEPRVKLRNVSVTALGSDGGMAIAVSGIYYPRALFGDFTGGIAFGSTSIPVAR